MLVFDIIFADPPYADQKTFEKLYYGFEKNAQ
jgi:16S rRNA G966 N2-methylase RsmD